MNAYLILGTIGVLALLIYVFKFNELIQLMAEFIKKQKGGDADHDHISKEEFHAVKEYIFYDKYVNVPFTDARTVTLANSFYEILKHGQNSNDPLDQPTFTKIGETIENAGGLNGHFDSFYNLNPSFPQYEKMEFDFSELKQLEDIHEKKLCQIAGVTWLGKKCLCGKIFCNWAPEVITQFLINTKWNVKNIKIFTKQEGVLVEISSNDIDKTEVSPNGDYVYIPMLDPDKIRNLAPGTETYIVFTLEVAPGILKCAVLKNIFLETLDGQSIVPDSSKSDEQKSKITS